MLINHLNILATVHLLEKIGKTGARAQFSLYQAPPLNIKEMSSQKNDQYEKKSTCYLRWAHPIRGILGPVQAADTFASPG
jgi:hypothetical protein